ncbi:MAG: HAD family hydrolase, partial [Ruthenibacterium sp.]
MRNYKAVFFDWDGTAVLSRSAPVDAVVAPMCRLLEKNVKLCVISGTTYDKIAGGALGERFPVSMRKNLFLGLARGAFNYGFNAQGTLTPLCHALPEQPVLEQLHQLCFALHEKLLHTYGLNTDIVFDRPNYCKLDLLCGVDRGEHLYFAASEARLLEARLAAHGFDGGLQGLIALAEKLGRQMHFSVKATTDAKYLEVGLSTKSDNVNFLLDYLHLDARDCCFWG